MYSESGPFIDEGMFLPVGVDYPFGSFFRIWDDSVMYEWIHGYDYPDYISRSLERNAGCMVHVECDELEGTADIVWTEPDGMEFLQTIKLGEDDFRRILEGADPVAEGWRDRNGDVLCRGNAKPSCL